jgi:hypothetical protein
MSIDKAHEQPETKTMEWPAVFSFLSPVLVNHQYVYVTQVRFHPLLIPHSNIVTAETPSLQQNPQNHLYHSPPPSKPIWEKT